MFLNLALAFLKVRLMRFLKGSISLQVRDQGLLHIVADARYITHSQLFQLAQLKALEFQRAVFNWRVRRLVNSGLLRKQVVRSWVRTAYTRSPAAEFKRWKRWESHTSVQNRFLQSEIEECPPIIDVGEQFLGGNSPNAAHRRATQSYKSRAYSINCSSTFPEPSSLHS